MRNQGKSEIKGARFKKKEIAQLEKNVKKVGAKDMSDYFRVVSLKVKCECGKVFYQP